jgi:hypothetical protein
MRTCTNNVSIKADVEAHLGLRDLGYHSHFQVALDEVRFLTGRDRKNGTYNPNHAYIGFVGLLGYLCIIDHLGEIFSPKNPKQVLPDPKTNSFKRLLYEFTNLSSQEINTLYGLRCSLAHNFSLANDDKRHLYFFSVVRSVTHPLIAPAITPWDGVFRDTSDPIEPYRTTVNMVKVGDLVEIINRELIALHQKNELDCITEFPQMELISRYAFIIRSKP